MQRFLRLEERSAPTSCSAGSRCSIRIIETATGQTWHHIRRDLDRLHAVTFTGPTGTFRQCTDPTKPQIDLYARLDFPLPKKIIEISAAGR